MREIIGFIVMMVVASLDPARLIGSFITGWFIKRRGIVIVSSIAWNLVLYFALTVPAHSHDLDYEPFDKIFLASICGSTITSLLIYTIACSVRKRRMQTMDESI
jgi:hypothetical protein